MHIFVARDPAVILRKSLSDNPVTALIGPRQCGKTTLVRHVIEGNHAALYLDLELPSDMRKLDEPELFFKEHQDRLICIDEIQHAPSLFPVLRAVVDLDRRPGRFLLLGSASRDLIRRGGETLAGRIHYIELTPFTCREIDAYSKTQGWDFRRHWWRGGFPPAFLAANDSQSHGWRRDLIADFLSRDIPLFGLSIPVPAMRRFWQMVAHYHGGILNASKLGQALDVSRTTVKKYLDILEHTFMIRILRPFEANVRKRLVKSPKVYLRDSGLLHTLLEVDTMTDLYGHPSFGASWEGWCIEQIITSLPHWEPAFYRTSNGEEIDLVMRRGGKTLVFEIKASLSPSVSKGFGGTLAVLQPRRAWIVCPMDGEGYTERHGARICGPRECLADLQTLTGPA